MLCIQIRFKLYDIPIVKFHSHIKTHSISLCTHMQSNTKRKTNQNDYTEIFHSFLKSVYFSISDFPFIHLQPRQPDENGCTLHKT